MRFKCSLLIIFLLNQCCFAQDLYLTGIASNYAQVGKINKNWSYNIHLSSVYNTSTRRIGEKTFPSGHAHFVPHLIFNRKVNSQINMGLGYAFGRHNIFGLRENEHRFLIQSAYNHSFKRFNFNHRARYELRIPKNLSTKIVDDASILRYQLGVSIPLYNTKEIKQGFYAHASNELFLYLKGATNGPVSSKNGLLLSENWSNMGLGYNSGKNRIEVGYGFQRLIRNRKQDLRCFNLLQINYFATINWDDVQFWWY